MPGCTKQRLADRFRTAPAQYSNSSYEASNLETPFTNQVRACVQCARARQFAEGRLPAGQCYTSNAECGSIIGHAPNRQFGCYRVSLSYIIGAGFLELTGEPQHLV